MHNSQSDNNTLPRGWAIYSKGPAETAYRTIDIDSYCDDPIRKATDGHATYGIRRALYGDRPWLFVYSGALDSLPTRTISAYHTQAEAAALCEEYVRSLLTHILTEMGGT